MELPEFVECVSAENDSVVEADVVSENDRYVFTVTENGMGKITNIEEYREQGRGGSGKGRSYDRQDR